MFGNKFIIAAALLLFVVASTVLASVEEKAADPNLNKNWWALSFVNPYDRTLGFTVENHGDTTYFSYLVTRGKKTIDRDILFVPKGKSVTVPLEGVQPLKSQDTIIAVWTADQEKRFLSK